MKDLVEKSKKLKTRYTNSRKIILKLRENWRFQKNIKINNKEFIQIFNKAHEVRNED